MRGAALIMRTTPLQSTVSFMAPMSAKPPASPPDDFIEPPIKKRAPTLYVIIVMKLLKGILFTSLALTAYTLSDNDLPAEFARLMTFLKVHPGNQFFANLAERIGELTEMHVIWAAAGTFFYSLFAWVEGIGLMFRIGWAGWLAIGESAFFIPIELYDLVREFSLSVLVVLIINIVIVWYLFDNRHTLFRHHHHAPPPAGA